MVNCVLEAGETVLSAALREIREEAGPLVRVRPLGTVYVSTCRYNPAVLNMLSIAFLTGGGESCARLLRRRS